MARLKSAESLTAAINTRSAIPLPYPCLPVGMLLDPRPAPPTMLDGLAAFAQHAAHRIAVTHYRLLCVPGLAHHVAHARAIQKKLMDLRSLRQRDLVTHTRTPLISAAAIPKQKIRTKRQPKL